ncbi:MAG: DUF1499 domain-containing protein [Candidatus Poribacteria bacterium]|nr:DUF1499 domain-containing protein [Candidatus Poribacteria bacterium]
MMKTPLPSCRSSLNCVLTDQGFDAEADALYEASRRALSGIGGRIIREDAAAYRLDAIFTTRLLRFQDDVSIAVADGRVYIRSASRIGISDFGLNRRRTRHFFTRLRAELG